MGTEITNQYSNGKLLLTGEYLVMKGAKAIAFPVKFGQSLVVHESTTDSTLKWEAFEQGKSWFKVNFDLHTLDIQGTNSEEKAVYLRKIFREAQKLNPGFLRSNCGLSIKTDTNFAINWGLGTSSTLINNMANWANINPFQLHNRVSKGSGYDIACANAKGPIIYFRESNKQANYQSIPFNKSFIGQLYFVYSGKKKRTEKHITNFSASQKVFQSEIDAINSITEQVLATDDLDEFIQLMKEHEKIIGSVIDWKPIGDDRFICFNGVVKSLGAWGGDFLLVATPGNKEYVHRFFEQNGLSVIIPYRDMVLDEGTKIEN